MKELIENYLIKQDIFYECMLLEYYYSESNHTFTWVGRPGLFTDIDLAKNPFIKICFIGISNYNHIFPKINNSFNECSNHFLTQNYVGSYVSHASCLKKKEGLYEIEIQLTYRLGSIILQFEDFYLEILNTECRKVDDSTFIYSIPETNEELDFYRPFGEIRKD